MTVSAHNHWAWGGPNDGVKSTAACVDMLVRCAGGDGNMLLNVGSRPDGMIDPQQANRLKDIGAWLEKNGESIYGMRPWLVYGEGDVKAKGGAFKENFQYTARDIRFTTKGKTLYAIALGWPAEYQLTIRSLARTDDTSANRIKSVELLGYKGKLKFTQTAERLIVNLPDKKTSDLTCSLKITGNHLKPAPIAATEMAIVSDSQGRPTLHAEDVALHGEQFTLEEQGGESDIGYWDKGDEWISSQTRIGRSGAYQLSAITATIFSQANFVVQVCGQIVEATAPQTGGWDKFTTSKLGIIEIRQPGEFTVNVRAQDPASWKAINLHSIRLMPVP